MGHAIHYRTSQGEPRFEEVGSLEDALAQVERLRNDGGVSDVRVFREVPISFKTYYKVEVASEETVAPAAPAPAASGQGGGPAPSSQATASPSAAATPPPGAMPLTPSASGGPAPADEAGKDSEDAKRGSLFTRG